MGYARKEVLAYDPAVKKRTTWHEVDRGNEWVVESKVDVTDIVEQNKAEFAATDEHTRWGKPGEVWAKVASIPNHIYFSLLRKGIVDPNDDTSLLRWIQNRDNMAWRSRPGRLV